MNRIFHFCSLVFFTFHLQAQGGIEFFEGTWEEALEAARTEEKAIFVDAYASWCGPCKRMARNVFTQPEVGAFYNKTFINVKLDYEKPEANTFRQKYPVTAFPTLYYIDYDGSVLQVVKGAQSVNGFIKLGKTALTKIDRTGNFEAAYEKGERSPEFMLKYIKALNQSGRSSLKIANEYLDSQEDLTTDENLLIILESTTEADSRIFDMLIENQNRIEKLASKEKVLQKIETACRATVKKAAEFKVEMLWENAKEKMEEHYPEKADRFKIEADMIFYKSTARPKDYLKACKKYAKKIIDNDALALRQLSEEMHNAFPVDKDIQEEAKKIYKTAEKLHGTK